MFIFIIAIINLFIILFAVHSTRTCIIFVALRKIGLVKKTRFWDLIVEQLFYFSLFCYISDFIRRDNFIECAYGL